MPPITRLSSANEGIPPTDIENRNDGRALSSTTGASKSRHPRRKAVNRGQGADEATSADDDVAAANVSQDAPTQHGQGSGSTSTPTLNEGGPVNGHALVTTAVQSANGAGTPIPPLPFQLVRLARESASGSTTATNTGTPGTSATGSSIGTGISTPASDVSAGTKRKRDMSDIDVVGNYNLLISELLGVLVRTCSSHIQRS